MSEEERLAALLPVHALLPDHGHVTLAGEDAGRFLSGLRRRGAWPDSEQVAVFASPPAAVLSPSPAGGGQGWGHASSCEPPSQLPPGGGRGEQPFAASLCLLGTAHIKAGELIPGRLLSPIEIQQILEPAS
jgi:tRNA pseudouridine55 synthase